MMQRSLIALITPQNGPWARLRHNKSSMHENHFTMNILCVSAEAGRRLDTGSTELFRMLSDLEDTLAGMRGLDLAQ